VLAVDIYIIECRSIIQFSFTILPRQLSAIRHTRQRPHNKCIPVCIIYSVGPSRARIAIITIVQHGISSGGSNFGPIGQREADNCCAEPDDRRCVAELRNPIYGGVLFFAFLRVVARAQKCSADIQRLFAFGGCSRQGRERVRAEKRRVEGGWTERRMD